MLERLPLPRPTKLIGLLSRPRFGPLDTQMCIQALSMTFGFTIRHKGGPYWEQSMQELLLSAAVDGFDVACTFDYDSLFTPKNFNTLLKYMQDNPHVDAVAPLQPMRGRDHTALMSESEPRKDEGHAAINFARAIPCRTAHFGLTLIRLDRLRQMPLPWFQSTPSPHGTWDKEDGAEDADIYFWRCWQEMGFTLEVLPWVSVGQLETTALVIEKGTGLTKKQFMSEWIEENMTFKPKAEGAA